MKNLLATMAFFAVLSSLLAQPFADAEYLSSTPFILSGATLIDLEGDGDLDAFTSGTNFNGEGIETWVNDNGTFNLVEGNIPFGQFGTNIFCVGDVDLDGDQDFVTLIKEKLIWYANDGTGVFATPVVIDDLGTSVRSIGMAELDDIPGPDLVISRLVEEDVLAYANDGAGNFGSAITVTTEAIDPIDVQFGDLDEDGLLDLAIACVNGCDVTWHKNLGGLSFGPQQILVQDQIGTYKLALADFDQNGHLDIASIGFGSDDLSLFFNSGAGVFGSRTIISTSIDGPVDMASGDFNNDGIVDLAVGTQEEKFATYFQGNGSGGFTQLSLASTGSISSSQQMLAGDVDGDGLMDVVTASSFDNKLALLTQKQGPHGANSVPFERQQLINKPATGINDLISVDIDGDGLDDLLSTERTSGRVVMYRNLSDGSFGEQEVLLALNEGLSGLDADDLDADGFVDIAVSSISDSTVTIFLNQGDGSTFIPVLIDQELDEPYSPFLSDLDADGDKDMIVSVGWDADVLIYPNNGDGTFGARLTLCDNCLFARATNAEDFNGDGLPEVFIHKGFELLMYENLGGLTFGESQVLIGSQNGGRDIEFNDFDGDGDLDVFSSAIYNPRIKYVENLGNLSFAPEADIPFNVNRANDIEFFDVDLDGDDDLAYTGGLSNSIAVIFLENGEFIEKKTVDRIYYNPTSLVSGDFDEDGKVDMVTGFDNFVAFYSSQALTCAALQPKNLSSVIEDGFVNFSWDPLPGTVACQLNLQNNQGESFSQNIIAFEPSGFTAPIAFFNPSSANYWNVRCACSINPLETTERSRRESFFVPAQLLVFPNPADDRLQIVIEEGRPVSDQNYRVVDLQGRLLLEGPYRNGVDLSGLESGYYLIQMDGAVSKFFKN